MRISRLIRSLLPLSVQGPADIDVSGLYYDSRDVQPGGAFFALRGAEADGHAFIDAAIQNGARAVFTEKEVSLPDGIAGIVVENTRKAMAYAAICFFGNPCRGMTLIGVTGTNGKTTVCYQLEAVFRKAGRRPAVLGTVNYRYENLIFPAPNTTPESIDLLRIISEFQDAGADTVIMEVSSHGLDQHRIDGLLFDVGVFTNLSPEHLDYHQDMDAYFAVKKRFFMEFIKKENGLAVINIDNPYGIRLSRELPQAWRCSRSTDAEIYLNGVEMNFEGSDVTFNTPQGFLKFHSRMFGSFNISNLMVSAGAALAAGIEPSSVVEGLSAAPQVPGRLEPVENDRGAVILVDYAHTADALKNVLGSLREFHLPRLLCLFGCGGDRDHSKRPKMAETAARLSDIVILTSDNPRSEDPLAILADVKAGIPSSCMSELSLDPRGMPDMKGFVVIADRREAIRFAVSLLVPGDLLVVAGKGHEDYQVVGKQRIHFDDREEIVQALAGQEVSP